MTKINTIAKMRLYKFVGGVPNGSQERNTKMVAIHKSGANPEKCAKKSFANQGQSAGGFTTFGPLRAKRADAVAVFKPKVMLQTTKC